MLGMINIHNLFVLLNCNTLSTNYTFYLVT